jgi:hypothetical protein
MSATVSAISATASKTRELGYWITTVSSAALFAAPGAALLAGVPHFTEDMSHLGYPAYFLGRFSVPQRSLRPVFPDSRNGPMRG